jgi:hypothetical protein
MWRVELVVLFELTSQQASKAQVLGLTQDRMEPPENTAR